MRFLLLGLLLLSGTVDAVAAGPFIRKMITAPKTVKGLCDSTATFTGCVWDGNAYFGSAESAARSKTNFNLLVSRPKFTLKDLGGKSVEQVDGGWRWMTSGPLKGLYVQFLKTNTDTQFQLRSSESYEQNER